MSESKRRARQNQDVIPSRSPYFKFYADDWIAGTLNLTLEQRGLYISVLTAMWSRRGPIPIDQMPVATTCDKRQITRLLPQLIDLGKLHLDAGNRVYNSRMNDLLQGGSREDHYATAVGQLSESSATAVQQLTNIFPENSIKTTVGIQTEIPPHPLPLPLPVKKKKKDLTTLARTFSVAASEPEIGALNGATSSIVEGIAGWLNNLAPDIPTARRIVVSNVGIFGSDAVRRAYADLQTDVIDGKLVGNVLKAFTGYCDKAKKGVCNGSAQSGGSRGNGGHLNKHERLKRAIAESNEELGITAAVRRQREGNPGPVPGAVLRGLENLGQGAGADQGGERPVSDGAGGLPDRENPIRIRGLF